MSFFHIISAVGENLYIFVTTPKSLPIVEQIARFLEREFSPKESHSPCSCSVAQC